MPIGTRHDDTKVLLGASLCPATEESVESVPGNIAAGLAVRQNTSTGAYQVAASGAGPIVGLSRGLSLGKAGTFALVRKATKAVIQLGSAHTPTVGTQVHVDESNGKTKASGSGATATAAIYEKLITGVTDEGSTVACAIIDLTNGF